MSWQTTETSERRDGESQAKADRRAWLSVRCMDCGGQPRERVLVPDAPKVSYCNCSVDLTTGVKTVRTPTSV